MSGTATTRWSLILAARGASPSAREALARLCEDYRPVVLAWFRRREPGSADDSTQAFFEHFLARQLHARADAARGSFRAFLYTAVRNHWRETLRHAGARRRKAPAATDEAMLADVVDAQADPEREFDRDWALHVLQRARERLRREVDGAGKAALFAVLEDCLLETPEASAYVRIGASLGMPANTVAVAVRRLRERLRTLVRHELADTLPPAADVDAELRWLRAVLRGD